MPEAQISRINEEMSCEQPGLLKRIGWVLTSPGKLMEYLAQKPRVLFGLILAAISTNILYIVRLPLYKEDLKNTLYATNEYLESMVGQSMTAEMVEKNLPTTVIRSLISAPFTMVFSLLFTTLIFFAILKIMGGQGKYKAYLSVTAYSYVIPALYILLVIPVSFVTGSLHQDIPLTSLATLASADMAGTFLYGILKGLTVPSIWNSTVMAIGLTTVSKLKKTNVYIVVGVIFIIGLMITGVGEIARKAFM